MDKFFLQLSELNRAGWSFEISPEADGVALPAVRAVVVWSLRHSETDRLLEGQPVYPLIDWINLFAPEIELRNAVAKMHARVFPISPLGDAPIQAK